MTMNKDTSQIVAETLTRKICSELERLDILFGNKATLGLKGNIYNIIICRLREGVEI